MSNARFVDIGVVIATPLWRHYLFSLHPHFSSLEIFSTFFSTNTYPNDREVWAKSMKTFSNYYFGMKFLWLETQLKLDNLNVRLLALEKRNTFEMLFHLVSSLLNTCERSWGQLQPIAKKDCFKWAVFNANYDNLISIIMRACRKKFVENFQSLHILE